MDKFLTFKFYFTIRPDSDFQYTKLTLALTLLLFLISITIRIYKKKYAKDDILKKMLKRYPGRFFWFGLILLSLLLFREAGIPILSMRIWWVLLFIYMAYWIIKTCITFKKEYKFRSNQAYHHDAMSKYLPKKKKK